MILNENDCKTVRGNLWASEDIVAADTVYYESGALRQPFQKA